MINHIDVSHVLRRCVCELYSNLVTRPTGVAVRTEIEQMIEAGPGGRTLTVIDFSNVGLLDFSCADEIVAKLLLRHTGTEGYFLFRGVNESHLDAIEAVLERHGLALVAQRAGDAEAHLVGVVNEGERSVWELTAGRGPLEVDALAVAAGVAPADAERLLDALWRRRLLMRLDGAYVVPGHVRAPAAPPEHAA